MTTATVTPTSTPTVRDRLRVLYLRFRLKHCERDVLGCEAGAAALEQQADAYRDAARDMRAELRRLGAL